MMRVAILDDYQDAARAMADWSALDGRARIETLPEPLDGDALVAAIADAQVVVAMRERTAFDAALLGRLPNLRLLVTTGMVNASIDMEAAAARGVTVCGTPGGGPAAAELAWALLLAVARRVPADDRLVAGGGPWQAGLGVELGGRTLGIVGFGRLGKLVARYGRAFDMEVAAWSRSLDDATARAHGVTRMPELDALLGASDAVTIHLGLSSETRGLFDAHAFAAMRPGAILVNTARGPIVAEDALLAALDAGRLRGAGLDVFDREPLPPDHPYRTHPSIVTTPHMGYVTEETYRRYFAGAVEAIAGWLDGAPVRVLAAP